ncbi:MAG: metallophosphoesterase family protein [Candidatus Bathyarchaeia archaeon]
MSTWLNKSFFRLFFATDIHGSNKTFTKFLRAASFYKADVLILGGDLTGKAVIPIKKDRSNFETELLGQKFISTTQAELQDVENRICLLGFYPYRTTPEEWNQIKADLSKYDSLYERLAIERIGNWVALAKSKLEDAIPLYVTGGNDDPPVIVEFLKSQVSIVNSEEQIVTLGGLWPMVSLGFSNHTPWKTPRECSEDELTEKIEEVTAKIPDHNNSIFNFHVPPYKSTIDVAPAVDGTVDPPKYILRNGMPILTSVGSTAVRSAIEKFQPLLGLHGHIHESKGTIKIGRTLCVNPGSEYSEGILKGVIVNLDEKGGRSFQFTSG